MKETTLEATRGDDNFFEVDATGDLDVEDQIWFRAARRQEDLDDTNAVIKKDRSTGVVDLEAAVGKCQVQLEPADTASLSDEALVYHVVLRKADVSMDTTIARGVMRLSG